MGNLEKLVVLVVLFLVAMVLGVTMNDSGEGAGSAGPGGVAQLEKRASDAPRGPLESVRRRNGELQPLPEAVPAGADTLPKRPRTAAPSQAGSSAPTSQVDRVASGSDDVVQTTTPLLNATIRRPGSSAAASKRPKVADDGSILRTRKGLKEIPGLADCLRYTVKRRDTWASLSERFYGERRYTDLLRLANDDPGLLSEGMELLVPLYDLTKPSKKRAPARPVQRRSLVDAEVTVYTVVSGDSLSVISQKVYGTSRRWREIYESNRKLLADEDTLQVGMQLNVPR